MHQLQFLKVHGLVRTGSIEMTGTVSNVKDFGYYEREEFKQSKSKKGRRDMEAYYGEDGKALNKYRGDACSILGFDEYKMGDMVKLSHGINPKDDSVLHKIRKTHKNHDEKKKKTIFTDTTLSAPKAFSLIYFLDEDNRDALEKLWERSVARSVVNMQDKAYARLNSKNEQLHGLKLIQVSTKHETARSAIHRPDPQIHEHVCTFHMALDSAGQLRKMDNYSLYNNQIMNGAILRAELCNGLRELGYPIIRKKDFIFVQKLTRKGVTTQKIKVNGFGVAGITDKMEKHFSNRTVAINKIAQATGKTSPIDKYNIAIDIRRNKEEFNRDDLLAMWKTEAKGLGLTQDTLREIRTNKDLQLGNYMTDEELIRGSIFNDGPLFHRNLMLRLQENEQYTGIKANDYYQHMLDKGIIFVENGYKLGHTLKLDKAEKVQKVMRLKAKVNPKKLQDRLTSYTKNFKEFESMYQALNMDSWKFEQATGDKKKVMALA